VASLPDRTKRRCLPALGRPARRTCSCPGRHLGAQAGTGPSRRSTVALRCCSSSASRRHCRRPAR